MSDTDAGQFPVERDVLDLLQEGIWVADGDGGIVFANSALASLLGYRSPEVLVGRKWRVLFPAEESVRVAKSRTPGRPVVPVDVAIKTRDDRQVAVSVALTRSKVGPAVWDIGSVLPAGRGIGHGPADAVCRQVMENSTDGICMVRNGKVSYVNRRFETLTGYTLKQVAQIGLERLIVSADRELIADALADPSRMLDPVHHSVRLVKRSAQEIDSEIRIVTAEDNGDTLLICFLRDVSELNRARQERTDFVATVSHELRTPLAAIKEAVSLVADSLGSGAAERPKRYLGIAQEEIARLNRMISNLLEVSRVESGRVKLALAPVDLRNCIAKTVESLAALLNRKRLRVELSVPDGLPPVLGDNDRLRLVFNNLLDNAIKYSPTGSVIRISARPLESGAAAMAENNLLPDTPYIHASVADTGPGIPTEFLERVFGRYERVDPHGPGIGLGLAIVRSVVEMHHGKVWVRSNLGEGTCFNLILPAGEAR